WFVGYTPDLVTAVWVGYPEGRREMDDVDGRPVTGGSIPAEIWASFMRAALGDSEAVDFERPEGLRNASVCAETGQIATEWCTETLRGLFLSGATPAPCATHAGPETVVVPELIGLTKERAVAELAALDLTAQLSEEEVRGVAAGIVARQDPVTGTELEPGSAVRVTVSTGVRPPQQPRAVFSVSPAEPLAGQPVSFDAAGSSATGQIVRFVWEFGDGASAEGVQTTHTFTAPGDYDVILWVTDTFGQTTSSARRIVAR
ncbi:MAG TPA: PKD domain-containing protein, partial [Coriobacteriia bacterium]|nr:PKD domain-containing protein [Coriobacteriia bacterium]